MATAAKASSGIYFGPYFLDASNKRLMKDGSRIALSPLEVRLLETLLRDHRKVFTGEELRILVWSDDPNAGSAPAGDANALYVAVRKLRSALGKDGKWIVNIPKVGYTIAESVAVSLVEEKPSFVDAPFVGRSNEMAAIEKLMPSTRLLTISGPPGIGKTRLALAAVERLEPIYPNGVVRVDLDSISDGGLVANSLLTALGLAEKPASSVASDLIEFLKSKRTLILFDNCDHLIEPCASLIESIIESCPETAVLATSRERFLLPAEVVFSVPPLDLPDPAGDRSLTVVAKSSSVALFLDLAERQNPGFSPKGSEIDALIGLCRDLEGIPLAIELAAVQTGVYTISQIRAAMSDRFRLLRRRGNETRRHNALEGTIDWSYSLLEEGEKQLLRRVAVFSGGWTESAARNICTGGDMAADQILPALASLVSRSLIQLRETDTGPRYYMLEMIRQFSRRRLEQTGESDEYVSRHSRYFVELAERSFEDGDRGEWPAILRSEYDNIRAVLRRTIIDRIEPIFGLRLAGALNRFWFYNGYMNEALAWTDLALAGDDGSEPFARARALTSAGFFFGQTPGAKGEAVKLGSYFEESLGIWRRLGDKKNLGVTLIGYSYMLNRMGEYDGAIATAEEALETFRQTDFHINTARAANNLALGYLDTGKYDLAKPLLEEALRDAQLSDDTFLQAICLHNLAELAIRTGDAHSAGPLLEECRSIFESLGHRTMVASSLMLVGEKQAANGEMLAAISTVKEALQEAENAQDNQLIAAGLEALGRILATNDLSMTLAVELISAARGLRDQLGISISPAVSVEIEKVFARIRDRIGADALTMALERGRRTPARKAVVSALEFDPTVAFAATEAVGRSKRSTSAR